MGKIAVGDAEEIDTPEDVNFAVENVPPWGAMKGGYVLRPLPVCDQQYPKKNGSLCGAIYGVLHHVSLKCHVSSLTVAESKL